MIVHAIEGATAAEVAEANRLLAAKDAPAFRELLADVEARCCPGCGVLAYMGDNPGTCAACVHGASA